MQSWPIIRDLILFVGGLAGAGYALIVNPDLPSHWLILFAAMMGLPAFLSKDEKRSGGGP